MTDSRRRELIKKWAPVLETDIGVPIVNSELAAKLAIIVETQAKLNPGVIQDPSDIIHRIIENSK